MSWSNQGGPWRSGQGPWGQGPSGPQPPGDLEEMLRRLQGFFRGLTPGGGGSTARWTLFGGLIVVILWLLWGFYTVQPNEVGINLVLGRYTGKTAAGLNYNWPAPIGSVIKVPVWVQKITRIGLRGDEDNDMVAARSGAPEESLMLTSDLNIVDVKFRVIWQIDPAKPEDFVFNIRRPEETVKAVAESVMREVVGLKTIDGILTTDRKVIEPDVQRRMQYVLDSYKAGVLIRQVQLQSVDAPAQVISAYRDVTAAQQDEQRMVNEAETYANRVVPEAEGSAARIVLEAKAYREQTVADAKGQTSRFNQVYEQYKNAPAVTRERMYLETMERVLGGMPKTILDVSGVAAPLPYLSLDQLQTNKPTGAAK
ncbi:MAG TPA: FtsH protease activity modulator HflK [Roseiarcus sp.]|nr:FtsH protease activity modulator HflK [Roseiarcus sp.]